MLKPKDTHLQQEEINFSISDFEKASVSSNQINELWENFLARIIEALKVTPFIKNHFNSKTGPDIDLSNNEKLEI